MIFLGFVFASLAAVNAQVRPVEPRATAEWNKGRPLNPPNHHKSNTVIENKNVNIIVNVDPKDVARELFTLIEGSVDGRRRSDDAKNTINELEKIIAPMVAPTRRSHRPTAFEVAYGLDHITRKALVSDHLTRPTIDDEIKTRDIVAKMMVKLKTITKDAPDHKINHNSPNARSMKAPEKEQTESIDKRDDDDDQYLNVKLKIRKSELLRRSADTSIDIDP